LWNAEPSSRPLWRQGERRCSLRLRAMRFNSTQLTKVFAGRLTIRLLNAEDNKIEEEVARKRNEPYQDHDRLQRKDCLNFGAEVLAGC
jgi:hypothetical protein